MFYVTYTRPDNGSPSYGSVRSYYKGLSSKQEKAIHDRGNLIVEDAIYPVCFEMNKKNVHETSCDKHWKFVQTELHKASKAAPKHGVRPGALFSIPVADGKAFYVVTKVNKTTCSVEWRGYGGDDYTDHWLGLGGKFPLNRIRERVEWQQGMDCLFGG